MCLHSVISSAHISTSQFSSVCTLLLSCSPCVYQTVNGCLSAAVSISPSLSLTHSFFHADALQTCLYFLHSNITWKMFIYICWSTFTSLLISSEVERQLGSCWIVLVIVCLCVCMFVFFFCERERYTKRVGCGLYMNECACARVCVCVPE